MAIGVRSSESVESMRCTGVFTAMTYILNGSDLIGKRDERAMNVPDDPDDLSEPNRKFLFPAK